MNLAGKTIGIVGLGQMGGSMAAALTRHSTGAAIMGCDCRPPLVKAALKKGIIVKGVKSLEDLLEKSEIAILATPISVISEILSRHGRTLSEKLLVADLGSIRRPIQSAAPSTGLANHVGLHFLCGTNLRGQASWNSTLYHGAQCFVFTSDDTDRRALSLSRQLVRLLKADPSTIDAKAHDDMFAVTSGLPHVFAFSLMKLWEDLNRPAIKGPSFDSATRVVSSDPALVSEMLFHNRTSILKAMSKLERNFALFKKALSQDDARTLDRFLKGCSRG